MLQVAANGEWERAATLNLPAESRVATALTDELPGARTDVAAELLWPGPPACFVGVRFPRDEERRLGDLAGAAAARAPAIPADALALLAAPDPSGAARAAELGAINAWRSTGPLAIPLDATAASVQEALAARPDLAEAVRPIALEIALEHADRELWIGVQCSIERDDGIHVTDPARVAAFLRQAGAD